MEIVAGLAQIRGDGMVEGIEEHFVAGTGYNKAIAVGEVALQYLRQSHLRCEAPNQVTIGSYPADECSRAVEINIPSKSTTTEICG